MTVRAIETEYKGYRFRSRLEARWAVAFDAMGIEWQYEPEGYVLDDGTKYLPDFKLMNVRHRSISDQFEPIFIEVKGYLTPEDKHKVDEFPFPIVLIGELPSDDLPHTDMDCDFWSFKYIDCDYYNGFFAKHGNDIWFTGPDHDEWDMGKLMKAGINAAKKARFEHGESGYTPGKPKRKRRLWVPGDSLHDFFNFMYANGRWDEAEKEVVQITKQGHKEHSIHWNLAVLEMYRRQGFRSGKENEFNESGARELCRLDPNI